MGPERRGRADQGQTEANPAGEEPRTRPKPRVKSYEISKRLVFEAWGKVRANNGAPGVDAVGIAEFAARERDNLYRLWNRMSSGSYFPGPVRAVEIPKDHGQGGQGARRAEHGGSGGPDRGSDAAGSQAGADLSPGQLRLSSWAQRP